jgi:hypothetical protein
MNFVSHFWRAAHELDSSKAGIGAMLPDLWGMVDRRIRPVAARAPTGDGVAELLRGIEHHLALDRSFHASPLLLRGEKRATEALRGAARHTEKLGLLGHIAWELCLDGALLRRNGVAPIKSRIAAAVGLVTRTELELALAEQKSPIDLEQAPITTRTLELLGHIVDSNWIDGYIEGHGLMLRLDGVRRRVKLPAIDPADRAAVAEALDQLLDQATAADDA